MMKPGSASTDGRPAALVLAPEAPYPIAGGGALRTASILEYLGRRYRLDCILFREPGAPDPREQLPPGLVKNVLVLDLPHNARHLVARLMRNADRLARGVPPLMDRFSRFGDTVAQWLSGRSYDVAVVEHFWCAPYWQQVSAASRRTVLNLHNVESVLHARCAATENGLPGFAHRTFERVCRDLETKWLPRYSCLLVPSEGDAVLLRKVTGCAEVQVYPNAIPLVALPEVPEEHAVVFSGNLEYHPNISAVRFFRREIWPALREQWPDLVWRLVGKNAQAVRRFTGGDERIQVHGAVQDAISEIARAQVAVVPLLAGSGTRFKIMEAWAAGRPVVSTTIGAEGLPARDGENLLLADGAVRFRQAVSKLLASPDLRTRLGRAGRNLVEKEFTWQAAWARVNL